MNHRQKHFESPLPARIASNPVVSSLSSVYKTVADVRNFAYDHIPALSKKLGRPAISVGGIRAGGTGKTPAAQLVGRHIIDNCGYSVAFLSRGYGRLSKKSVIIKPNETANWEDAGDEPCMIRNNIPESWLGIGADRTALAKKLSSIIPTNSVFILDDGFQRRQTRRDLDIVCLNESAFDDRMMPAGYLREPASSLRRADIVFVIGAEERLGRLREVKAKVEDYLECGMRNAECGTCPSRRKTAADAADEARLADKETGIVPPEKSPPICAILLQRPVCWVEAATGRTVIPPDTPPLRDPYIVCGIARPERFIGMVKSFGIEPSGVQIFRDHHIFKNDDFEFAHDIYSKGVLTTEKDFIRLRSKKLADARGLWYLKIELGFADSGAEAPVLSKINCITL
jgi:tetraacyldisaccharide 4'-kinase